MFKGSDAKALAFSIAMLTLCSLSCGCVATGSHPPPIDQQVPKELAKISQLPYVIEPPDILLIDVVRTVPLPPYKIQPLDGLYIQATNTFPTDPIAGIYSVEPEGTVNLGLAYGIVRVADLTLEEAKAASARREADLADELRRTGARES